MRDNLKKKKATTSKEREMKLTKYERKLSQIISQKLACKIDF